MASMNLIFLLIFITSMLFTRINTLSLPMIPLDSPRLQIVPQNLNTQDRYQFLKNISMARVSSYYTRRNSSLSTNTIDTTSYRILSNYYVTEIFFGTGQLFSPYVILDTGDDRTWIQCAGCNPCFEVKGGNIQPSNSTSYKLLNYDDPRCNPRLLYHWACGFKRGYGGDPSMISSTTGLMGTDTFLFINSDTHKPQPFQDLAFGCGLENRNFSFGLNNGPNNPIAGVFGLAPGPQSFLTQLDGVTQGRFSYCLTSWAETNPGISTVHFGPSAQIEGPDVLRLNTIPSSNYQLFLRGISVDGKSVPYNRSFCAPDFNKELRGFIIDSGAPYMLLPRSIYQPFKSLIMLFFARFGLEALQPYQGPIFDLCYRYGPKRPEDFPKIIFQFTGSRGLTTNWIMENENMFLTSNSDGGFCMVVEELPDPGPCILGAYQQANFRISHDSKKWKLDFKPERCQENLAMYDRSDMINYAKQGLGVPSL